MKLRLLDNMEYKARKLAQRDFINEWRAKSGWTGDPPYYPPIILDQRSPFFDPGMIFYQPDIFDYRILKKKKHRDYPKHFSKWQAGQRQIKSGRLLGPLSRAYWEKWADRRPPIAICCPDGQIWQIDYWSDGGIEWNVNGFPDDMSLSVEGFQLRTQDRKWRVEGCCISEDKASLE